MRHPWYQNQLSPISEILQKKQKKFLQFTFSIYVNRFGVVQENFGPLLFWYTFRFH